MVRSTISAANRPPSASRLKWEETVGYINWLEFVTNED